jgi:2-C-methyl-D-erythritol 4-phosphate cytidylyltransferase
VIWALVPAAGSGRRMAGNGTSNVPKQYLALAGRTVLEHGLSVFLAHPRINGVVVVLAPDDNRWKTLSLSGDPRVRTAVGGAERADSVLAGLRCLLGVGHDEDWVLVHDAARPCIQRAELDRLLDEAGADPVGGLLAVPVRDTVKQAHSVNVEITVDRSKLWLAQTPQMFRLGLLHQALSAALAKGQAMTDESSAMEQAGYHPRLVQGSATNIKITCPDDLVIAEALLQARQKPC